MKVLYIAIPLTGSYGLLEHGQIESIDVVMVGGSRVSVPSLHLDTNLTDLFAMLTPEGEDKR